MIDNLFKFADEATAKADPILGSFVVDDGMGNKFWRGDICIPGQSVTKISTGVREAGWILTVSTDQLVAELVDHPNCMLVVDWDNSDFVKVAPGYEPTDYAISPIFAGRDPSTLFSG